MAVSSHERLHLNLGVLVNVIFRVIVFVAFATRIFGHFRYGLIRGLERIFYNNSVILINIWGLGRGRSGSWLIFSRNV